MNFDVYIPDKEIANYLDRKGYTIISVRRLLKKKFGFKNTEDMIERLKVAESLLRAKLAIKNQEEMAAVCLELGGLIEILLDPEKRKGKIWKEKADVYFLGGSAWNKDFIGSWCHDGKGQRTVADYGIKRVFKEIFKRQYNSITKIERIQIW